MPRFFLLIFFVRLFDAANAQNKLPATYLFDEPPTAIFAQSIYSDTIVCMGVVFKEGDTIHYQQGAFIAFIDSCGSLTRNRKYFDAQGRDIFLNLSNKIIQTSDGGYCFVGQAETENLMIKTNHLGDSIFMRTYPIPDEFDYASFISVHEISNSIYVIGFGGTQQPFEDDLFMVKFDQEGNQLNLWRFHTPENCEYFQDAIVKEDNIVISMAQSNACISSIPKSKTRIFEVDTSGNILWDWVDDESDLKRGWGLGLKPTPDGGWIYAGGYNDTFYNAVQFDRLFVTKIDSNKKHEWTHIIGYQENSNSYGFFKDIVIDAEGNYIVAGQYKTGHPDFPTPNPAICAIVMKISPTGEILWRNIVKAFENGPDTTMFMLTTNVNLLSSGNIIIGGYLYRTINNIQQNEGWLAKLSPNGEVLDDPDPQCGIVSVQQPKIEYIGNLLCYPNPANEVLYLQVNDHRLNGCSWRLFDAYGQMVYQENIEIQSGKIEINVASLPQGMYFWEAWSKGKSVRSTGKIIKQ